MPDPDFKRLEQFAQTANALADLARESTLRYFRKLVDVDTKSDASPVTIADRETEQRMRSFIRERHPEHGICGEEFEDQTSDSPWLWTIDPIDGTKSFVSGKPTFGSLIALSHDQQPVIGVIEMPALAERWVGIAGRPTVVNGRPCRTSRVTRLNESILLSTTPDMFSPAEWETFNRISRRARVRNFGTDCLGYGLLASGHTDAVIEADLKVFDFMALIPVVEGAGGVISDWRGDALTPKSIGQVLASANMELHHSLLAELAEAAR